MSNINQVGGPFSRTEGDAKDTFDLDRQRELAAAPFIGPIRDAIMDEVKVVTDDTREVNTPDPHPESLDI